LGEIDSITMDPRPARLRRSGVLLHPTSLPGPFGCGDLGPEAERFLDWIEAAGQTVWQLLPLGPAGPHLSPYNSPSAFAGNPSLISPEALVADGLLSKASFDALPRYAEGRLDREAVRLKTRLIRDSYLQFVRFGSEELRRELEAFRDEQRGWLEDWSLYATLAEVYGELRTWPTPLRMREPQALRAAFSERGAESEIHVFAQFLFHHQWQRLHESAKRRGILLMGDVPIYVAGGSADVWAQPSLFQLDLAFEPEAVSGVPPDAFSETGQLWGNPLYDWAAMAEDGFSWWVARMRRVLSLTDSVRIDHFRAFAGFWSVPAGSSTAETGSWTPGPGIELFAALRAALGDIPVVAEDLGSITPDVEELLKETGLPGMRVLQFGLPNGDSTHAPHRMTRRSVCYTGTHDNDTSAAWFEALPEDSQRRVRSYVGEDEDVAWAMVRAASTSVAGWSILPVQDVLSLGSEARMNTPAQSEGNWVWRLSPGTPGEEASRRLRELTEVSGRLPR